MNDTVLVTFGCSWMYGVGANYEDGMTPEEYRSSAWRTPICDEYSFRGILSRKLGFTNINFARGGSSNAKQFRLVREFFISDEFNKLREMDTRIVVLHAITSTARTEMFLVEEQQLSSIKFDVHDHDLSKAIFKYSYDHNHEVERLGIEMNFYNKFYESIGIENHWLDTFNHHSYTMPIARLIGENENPRDMLSQMALRNGISEIDDEYHMSSWVADSNRTNFLVDNGFLNPISLHPTKKGHSLIADIIENHIK